jgi:hypothetical protein
MVGIVRPQDATGIRMPLNEWIAAMGLLFAIIGCGVLLGFYIGHHCVNLDGRFSLQIERLPGMERPRVATGTLPEMSQ